MNDWTLIVTKGWELRALMEGSTWPAPPPVAATPSAVTGAPAGGIQYVSTASEWHPHDLQRSEPAATIDAGTVTLVFAAYAALRLRRLGPA